ncbi:MAG: hypothetical protein OWT28_11745 [Firmicutes bacterium]|nr:hypothetical protein [Bacillota bacterium]
MTNANTGAQFLQLYIENVGTQEVAEKQSLWFIYSSIENLPMLRVTEFDFSRVPGSNGFATVQMGAQVQWIGPFSLSQSSYIYVTLDTMRIPAKSATQSGKY